MADASLVVRVSAASTKKSCLVKQAKLSSQMLEVIEAQKRREIEVRCAC